MDKDLPVDSEKQKPAHFSSVLNLQGAPNLPFVDPRIFPADAQVLKDFTIALDRMDAGRAHWTGPYGLGPTWEWGRKDITPVLSDSTHEGYVGPLFDGEIPTYTQWYSTKKEGDGSFPLTPFYVMFHVSDMLLERERFFVALTELKTKAPCFKEEADKLLAAIDSDITEQGKVLPSLRFFFCAFGPDARNWKDSEATKAWTAWERLTTWNAHETPLCRLARKAEWDIRFPPLNITEEQLQEEGYSATQATQLWRGLRPLVDAGAVKNTYEDLLAKAKTLISL